MTAPRRLLPVLAGGLAFGVVMAALKGQDAGARAVLGNLSAPWVLLGFAAGARFTRIGAGLVAGVAATLAAFLGFYVAEAAILDLGPHPWYVDLRLTLQSGHVYEIWGLLSGSLYGALGALWRSRAVRPGALAVGLAFLAEPLIVAAVTRAGVWGGDGLFAYPEIWAAEVGVGIALVVLAMVDLRRAPGGAGGEPLA